MHFDYVIVGAGFAGSVLAERLATQADKKILIIDSSSIYVQNANPDIILLVQSPKLNLQRLLKTCRPKQIVADGSNFKSYIAYWKATCNKEKIPFHYTNEKGYYKL